MGGYSPVRVSPNWYRGVVSGGYPICSFRQFLATMYHFATIQIVTDDDVRLHAVTSAQPLQSTVSQKPVSDMTYNVVGGTLNPAQPPTVQCQHMPFCSDIWRIDAVRVSRSDSYTLLLLLLYLMIIVLVFSAFKKCLLSRNLCLHQISPFSALFN